MLHNKLLSVLMFALVGLTSTYAVGSQVLVKVGDVPINEDELEMAMVSAPFFARFPSMDEDTQAGLRGNMLLRLVNAELLRQEAAALSMDKSSEFKREVDEYRDSILYQRYIKRMKDEIQLPEQKDRELKQRYRGNPGALAASRSVYISGQFKTLRNQRIQELQDKYKVSVDEDVFANVKDDNDIVARGSFFTIKYADIKVERHADGERQLTLEREHLDDLIDLRITAHAAVDSGIDVSEETDRFAKEILPRLLLDRKQAEWISGTSVLRDYYQKHPELSHTPDRQHVAQIVLPDCEQARDIRQRIMAGESMHRLASEYSIDPQGRRQAGDMGWLVKGRGNPALEDALSRLAPGETSEPVKTAMGCHLVHLVDRKPGRQRAFPEMSDAVKQALLTQRLNEYLNSLAKKYTVQWQLPTKTEGKSKQDSSS